jgi:hypothetical protein
VTLIAHAYVGAGQAGGRGVQILACFGASLASVLSNLFVSESTTFNEIRGSGCSELRSSDYPSAMESALGALSRGNVAVRPGCIDASCVAGLSCADAASCGRVVFKGWPINGVADIEQAKDLVLRSDGRCAINGVLDTSRSPATDVFGTPRSHPFSIGAAEVDSCVQ